MADNCDRIMFSSNNNTDEQHPSVLNSVHKFPTDSKRWRRLDFVYSFLPIYYFSRFFGLMPFSFIYDSDDEIQAPRISIFDGVWFVITIGIYLVAAFTNFQILTHPKEMALASALYYGHYILLIQGLLVCSVAIGLDIYNRNRLVTILKIFIAFDKEVSVTRLIGNCWMGFQISKKFIGVVYQIFWGTPLISICRKKLHF